MAKKKKKSDIQNNYVKLGIILAAVILVVLIGANVYRNIVRNRINEGRLTGFVQSVNFNEISTTRLEFSGDIFLYVSFTGDRDVFNLDTRLKRTINDRELNDNIIYLDMKDFLEDDNHLYKLNAALVLTDQKINKLPAILYFKDGELMQIIDSQDRLLNSGDFSQLLDEFEINND